MAAIDETGKIYKNYLVIKKDLEKTKNKKRAYWICKCRSCNNVYSFSGSDLRLNRIGECPTCKDIKHIGEKFGNLTIINVIKMNDRHIQYECKCQCGNIQAFSYSDLLSGKQNECIKCKRKNNPQYIDETGNQYGLLTVLKYDKEKSAKNAYWLCKCQCGNIVSVSGSHLRDGHTKSCGCIKSHGESLLISLFAKMKFKFETQKTFETCKFKDTGKLAKFDFYLPDYNCCIEYDGEQHFHPISGWSDEQEFLKIQERDNFKNYWCKENNIKLIRIPYLDYEKINEKYLEEKING